jgi:hypothetical protein
VVLVAGDNLVVDDRGFVGRACAGWRAQYQQGLQFLSEIEEKIKSQHHHHPKPKFVQWTAFKSTQQDDVECVWLHMFYLWFESALKEIADPDRPVPPEGYESDDENGSGSGRFSSADDNSGVDDNNGSGRFSSGDENSGVDDNNGGRFSSGDENSGVDDNNGGRFSSGESSDEKESNGLSNDMNLLRL